VDNKTVIIKPRILQKRDAKAMICCGMQGSGKTYTTMEELKVYQKKYQRPVLIVDRNGEYKQYKAIYYDSTIKDRYKRAHGNPKSNGLGIAGIHLPRIYRIIGRRPDGTPMGFDEMQELILTINQYYTNGALILEEMNSYIRKQVPRDFYSFFTNLRHRGVDVWTHYQGVKDAHPDIWGQVRGFCMHKTMDSVCSIEHKLQDNFEICRIAELAINKNYQIGMAMKRIAIAKYGNADIAPKYDQIIFKYHIYYALWIDFDYKTIGGISKEDFIEACRSYIYQHDMKNVNNMLNEFDQGGRKKFRNKHEVVEYLIKEKMIYIK
jgi:hypothetical protein